jgi:hypothetical protein
MPNSVEHALVQIAHGALIDDPAIVEKVQHWPVWTCKSVPDPTGRFQESQWWLARPGVGEERCLILRGQAVLVLPGGEEVIIKGGDWVVFKTGFTCEWRVEEEISKHYNYYFPDGTEWKEVATIPETTCFRETEGPALHPLLQDLTILVFGSGMYAVGPLLGLILCRSLPRRVSLLAFLCYALNMSLSTASQTGSMRSTWLRKQRFFCKCFEYNPLSLVVRDDVQLDPARKYIVGIHPHGIFPATMAYLICTSSAWYTAHYTCIHCTTHLHTYTLTLIHAYTHTLIHAYTHTLTLYTYTCIRAYTHTLILIHSYTPTLMHTFALYTLYAHSIHTLYTRQTYSKPIYTPNVLQTYSTKVHAYIHHTTYNIHHTP